MPYGLPSSAARRKGKRLSKARRKYSKKPSLKRRIAAVGSIGRAARNFRRAMMKG